uniref:Uncharacterized protein n=1 Tax=Leersia perrieri TaxID=77586 RepID=A0A0D9UXY0_9ORYZ
MQPVAAVTGGGGGGGGGMEPGFGKRLMHVLRAVYHMLRRGLCRKRLMMDLHLLLGRGKLAGRALRHVLLAHHHPHAVAVRGGAAASAAGDDSSSSPDAAMESSFYHHNPRDVEFSCTTTPTPSLSSFAPGAWFRGGRSRHAGGGGGGYGGLDASVVARVFEMLNTSEVAASPSMMGGATPSPLLALSLGRSPAGARQLRVTDSPFPVEPAEGVEVDGRVDDKATDFIKRFRQQLLQQPTAATPEYYRG